MTETITGLLQEAERNILCSDTARLDAEILLCDVMRFDRSTIFAHPEKIVPEDKSAIFKSLVEQRRQGHPVAHLTGKKEFWSLQLAINNETLIPRPETECLVEAALKMIPHDETFRILDLGTGSGAIAIAIASERENSTVVATDINPSALALAQENAANLHLGNIQFLRSDWYQDIPAQSFDLIVSNPPYIKQDDAHLSQGDVRFEPELALVAGSDGMHATNLILENAGCFLVDGAVLMIEHGHDQKALVNHAFMTRGFKQIKNLKDLSGQDRIAYGQLKCRDNGIDTTKKI